MFDFVFGGKRKMELIRELLEQRMRGAGFDDMDSRLKIKELGNLQLMGTPEGVIVTIIETVIKSQKQGVLLAQIILAIENHRQTLGSDIGQFLEIIDMANESEDGASVIAYCYYRLNIEQPGRVSLEQCMIAINQCAKEISTW